MTDSHFTDLSEDMQLKASAWLDDCDAVGLDARIIVSWRSAVDQNEAKAKGLSNASAGESPHNCVDSNGLPASCAFDFGIFRADGSYVTDGTDPRYREAGEIGKKLGLKYGGDWTPEKDGRKPDYDHLELPNWKKSLTST